MACPLEVVGEEWLGQRVDALPAVRLRLGDSEFSKVASWNLALLSAITAMLDGLPKQLPQPSLGQQHSLGGINLDGCGVTAYGWGCTPRWPASGKTCQPTGTLSGVHPLLAPESSRT